MRLLEVQPDGDFHLTENLLDDAIPQYAILSHTWGKDSEEVTFEDMAKGLGRDKAGYEKIKFCGEQAVRDGLRYFWVDSCCIDREMKAELSQAIRSMFRWYRNAARCYVYLSDVSTRKRKRGGEDTQVSPDQAFRKSIWFTRGWTLQELLAPRSVEFFSQERQRLGDRSSLRQPIHEVTCIPMSALEGTTPSQFTVNERFLWMEHRQTKLEEDKAYSLLGIFGVSITPIYGEGVASAFERLREEIDKLEKCKQALYLTDPRKDKMRIEDAKGGLLVESYHWIFENPDFHQWRDDEQSHLLWIKGDPGKGKTMLLCGIVDELSTTSVGTHLLSYFFCQATDSRINNATAVLRGLLFLLIDQQPSLTSHIQKQYDHAGRTLFKDANAWVAVSEIFTNILHDPSLQSTYLIIDALDECTGDLPKLLDFIIRESSTSPHVKWLVSSRNWLPVEEQLFKIESGVRLRLELNAESVSAAVLTYIKHKVDQLVQEKKYDDETRDAVFNHLSSNANGTFLWVALVYQHLRNVYPWKVLAKLKDFPPGLNSLYKRMIEQIDHSDDADICKRMLALTAIVYRPITLEEAASLADLPENITQNVQWLAAIIRLCGSFLTIRDGIVYLVHQSAQDYLLDEASDIFPSGKEETHYGLFLRSLRVLSSTLRRDIYELHSPGCLTEEVKTPDPDPLAASRYSCVYWIDHLCNSSVDSDGDQKVCLQNGGEVDVFVKEKYLNWLEALSLCRSVPKAVLGMAKLERLMQARPETSVLLELVRDARRFILYHKQAIQTSPLQVYVSALIFSPTDSLVRRHFESEEPKWITLKPRTVDKWSRCLQTLEGHSANVSAVAFSHDSIRLASASYDKTVRVWDANSGECMATLKGHSHRVNAVAFSHDSTRLASASWDNTVRVWDAGSGECVATLEGHSDGVNAVAFSHDSTRLASASSDRTVRVWDAGNGECVATLECHSFVWSVAFSHDSIRLASASDYSTVRVWDAGSGECVATLEGHSNSVRAVVFSHDSTRLALASWGSTVQVWDAGSGECVAALEGHSDAVSAVAFSHDSTHLVSASSDCTVRVWDAGSGECVATLEGHSGDVNAVAFSHDSTRLASASGDRTVRVWDAGSGECAAALEGHSDIVSAVAFSHDSSRLASASYDNMVRVWDASSGECVATLEGHSDRVWSVAFSHDSTRLASASSDKTVRVWDAGDGECVATLEGHSGDVNAVAFSHDSIRLASASDDNMVRVWDAGSGECVAMLEGHSNGVNAVAFSHDSTRLASASWDNTVRVWDAGSDLDWVTSL